VPKACQLKEYLGVRSPSITRSRLTSTTPDQADITLARGGVTIAKKHESVSNWHYMIMSRKRPARSGNPDLRRGMQVPGPPIEEIEAKLLYWLTPDINSGCTVR
jgi:hypothetical protein